MPAVCRLTPPPGQARFARDKPHRGCKKFAQRFGQEALLFVNSPVGRELRLRGVNARVVTTGTVRVGDAIHKQPAELRSGCSAK